MQKEYEYTGKAMGTDFSISIVSDSKEVADILAYTAIEKIRSYEDRFSRFLPQSELSEINRKKDLIVSDIFFEVTTKAYALFTLTRGVFNPLVQIDRLGYTSDFDSLTDSATPYFEEEYSIDFTETYVNPVTHRITLLPGQKLDFGGFLKGYLATQLAQEIKSRSASITGVIVNIGGDIHTEGYDAEGEVFIFTIYNPQTDKDDIIVPLHNMSLATSGIYKRSWKRNGQSVHHILDPSGKNNPDTEIISASIIHKDGGTGEAFAKVFISLGKDRAIELLSNHTPQYILITKEGAVINHIL